MLRRFKLPAAVFLAGCSAASMLLGFARELVGARLFGASRELDVFLLCFMPFDLLLPATRDVPVAMQGRLAQQDRPRADRILRQTALGVLAAGLGFSVIYALSCMLALGGMRDFALTPSWMTLIVILALSVLVAVTHIPLSALGMLRHNITVFHGLQQVYLNAGIVLCLVALGTSLGVFSLAIGVLAGTATLLLHEWLRLRRDIVQCAHAPAVPLDNRAWLMLIGFVALQAIGSKSAMLVERTVGLSLAEGTISHLNYALRVWGIPVNLFVIAAIVPYSTRLARLLADSKVDEGYRLFRDIVLRLSLLFLPFVIGLAFFADPLVALLFESGRFTSADTRQVADLLAILVWGSFGALLSTAAVYTLWAFGRSASVALVTWVSVATYFAVAWGMSRAFGATGLAAGNVIYYNLQAVLLLVLLRRQFRPGTP